MASSRGESAGRSRAEWRLISRALTPALVLFPLLIACGSGSPSAPDTITLPPAAPGAAAPSAPAAAAPQPAAGFTPLPTPQQVVAALPTGRVDPFAPLAAAKVGDTSSPPAGGELRFTGVIRSAGQSQALVQFGEQSGAVCVGQRGVCPGSGLPALLPAGWSVTSIDVASGRLVLTQAGQRRVLNL